MFIIYLKDEKGNCSKWLNVNNYMLLLHGKKIFNYLEIFSNRLQIVPSKEPNTRYLFGKGFYFASMLFKSIKYSVNAYDIETNKKYFFISICEMVINNAHIYENNY